MQLEVISTKEKFVKLKESWLQVYCADKDSTVQRSWGWMKGWIECTDLDWFILGARNKESGEYLGFFVLSHKGNKKKCSLELGGGPWAARTGILCHPDYQKEILKLFARYIQNNLVLDVFNLREVCDGKLDEFLGEFSKLKYKVIRSADTSCPQIELAKDWESYTQNYLKKSRNSKLNKYLRRAENGLDYRVVYSNNGDLKKDFDALLKLWQNRFGEREIEELRQIKKLWEICYQENQLWYEIIYDGEIAVAGLAAFTDNIKGCISPFMMAYRYDKDYSRYSLGLVIVAHSLKYALDKGFKVYDFGRGNSEYKTWFGATNCNNKNYIIRRRNYIADIKSRLRRLVNVFK